MSGLIWSALGQSVGNISSNIGNYMMRAEQDEERQRERAELQRERLAAAERENERNRQLRMDLSAQRGAGGSSGGLSGDALDEAAAGEAGMSLPEYRAARERFKTGDMSALKRDVQKVSMTDTGDPYAPEMTSTTVNEVPKELEQEERAKWKTIERLRAKYSMGEKFKGLTEGEQNEFETSVAKGVIGGAINRDVGAGAIGAMKGTGAYKESGGTVVDQYRGGKGVSTSVGESQIAENKAQAAKYGAEADKAKREPAGKSEDLATLQQMRKSAEETMRDARKALTEFDKVNQGDLSRPGREKLKQERDGLITEVNNARGELQKISERLARRLDETEAASKPAAAKTPAPSPAAGGALPEPKTPEEVAKLKPGTRFRAPDGSIRIR